ncbi:MAG: LicD family protein [Methanobrevibacter ruminantium]|uniref:LicD family protein n=1 Tax=Methanobrevibacter ruminantium TaxID=83816 RepID=UPI002D7E4FA1|nr:LicD family protein [Methanobrevibacter ruminantium]MCI5736636.1 LicD family protein [Methanobrevibacter ruminantium]
MGRLNTVQKNLFQLLTEIDSICKDHGIEYFLAGGTALGTVRNHAFLPWDDDIDLYITRDNWNKLRDVLENEENVLPEGRSFVYNENTKYYCNPIPRYVDNTTTAIYKSQALAGKACGQHIELLIMDPIPKDEEKKQEYVELLHLYTELLSPYFVVNKNLSIDGWKKHYELYKDYCKIVDKEGEEKVLKELEDKLASFASDEDCDTYCMRWGINTLIYKKEHYGNGRLERFEEGEFPVGEKAEGIFRVAYGDSWMYIPEYEEQVVHNALQDIETPFNEYTDRYLKKINRESVFKQYRENKRNNASAYYYRLKVNYLIAKEKVAVYSKRVSKKLDGREDELRLALENKEYEYLSQEFKDYITLQFIPDVRKNNIIVPISDKNLATLVMSLIEQGKYYDANKFLNIRKINDEPYDDELVEIEKTINICRDLSIARYDKKDEEMVKELIKEYESEYPNLIDIYRAKLWIKEKIAIAKEKNDAIEEYESIDQLCDEALEIHPYDGETMAIQAKAKLELGNKEEAMELYNKAIFNTRNGIIWQKVEDETGISRIDMERDLIEELNYED